MTQAKTFGWTNPATAVARNENVGFSVSEITTVDITTGGSFYWNSSMADASYLDVDAGTITATNGFTPISQSATFGSAISGFTNANPGVITASNVAAVGFAAGDTIKVAGLADAGTALSLNGTFTVASVTATTITLVENTSAPTYSAYVSGGFATRVTDINGDAVVTENVAVQGITIGSDVVGANNAVMVCNVKGDNSVT